MVEPDFVFYDRATGLKNLNGGNVLFAAEVADTSLAYDLGSKSRVYAAFGVRELWVIDALKLLTHVMTGPSEAGYANVRRMPGSTLIAPLFAPELAVTISELDLV